MTREEYDEKVRAIHYMMRDAGYRAWNTEVITLLSQSVTNLCGKREGDLLGQYAPLLGWVIDIQGRRAEVADFPAAVAKMREWSWVI